MAISRKIQGSNTYIIYGYVVNGSHKRVYCGKEGDTSTKLNLERAKNVHFKEKMAHAEKKLFGRKSRRVK